MFRENNALLTVVETSRHSRRTHEMDFHQDRVFSPVDSRTVDARSEIWDAPATCGVQHAHLVPFINLHTRCTHEH